MKNAKTVEEFSYDKLYKNILDAEEKVVGRPPRIRMSSFPFCPKKYIFECLEYLQGNATWSFQGDFYCGIGTSVHSTLQKWVPLMNPGHILGHWSCDRCGKWIKDTNPLNFRGRFWQPLMSYSKVGPVKCSKCGQFMRYEEFEFKLPQAPVTGHCDGIMLFNPEEVLGVELTSDNYYILDKALRDKDSGFKFPAYILEYKTAGRMAAMQRAQPKLEHRCQASMYVGAARSILAKDFGLVNLDMKGFIVKYIARDTPMIRSQDMKIEIDEKNDFYYSQCNYVNIFDKAVAEGGKKNKKLMWNTKPCEDMQEVYVDCSYKDICNEMDKKSFVSYIKQVKPLYELVRVK